VNDNGMAMRGMARRILGVGHGICTSVMDTGNEAVVDIERVTE